MAAQIALYTENHSIPTLHQTTIIMVIKVAQNYRHQSSFNEVKCAISCLFGKALFWLWSFVCSQIWHRFYVQNYNENKKLCPKVFIGKCPYLSQHFALILLLQIKIQVIELEEKAY